jgi:hypothetical protein
MIRKVASRIAVLALLVPLAGVLMSDKPALGDGPVKKVLKKDRARGHLPKYYANVVTEEQREKILKIQEEYKPKIEALETQLKALKKERDDKVSAVLTEEQKKKVEEAKAMDKGDAKDKGDVKDKGGVKEPPKAVEPAPPAPTDKPAS